MAQRPESAAPAYAGRRPFYLMLVFCLVLLVLRAADLALFTDPVTGFVRDDWFALRLLLPLLAALAGYLLSRRLAQRPAALLGRCPLLGNSLLAVGVALLAAGLIYGLELLLPGYGSTVLLPLRLACSLLSAAWFLWFGVRAFSPLGDPAARLPGSLNILAGAAFFFCVLLLRFTLEAASVQRLGCTLRVLSAATAMLFLISLFRVFLTPGLPVGRSLFSAGFNIFLFGSCQELPQALFEWAAGTAALSDVAVGLTMGLLGLAGLAGAWYACSEDAALPCPEKTEA